MSLTQTSYNAAALEAIQRTKDSAANAQRLSAYEKKPIQSAVALLVSEGIHLSTCLTNTLTEIEIAGSSLIGQELLRAVEVIRTMLAKHDIPLSFPRSDATVLSVASVVSEGLKKLDAKSIQPSKEAGSPEFKSSGTPVIESSHRLQEVITELRDVTLKLDGATVANQALRDRQGQLIGRYRKIGEENNELRLQLEELKQAVQSLRQLTKELEARTKELTQQAEVKDIEISRSAAESIILAEEKRLLARREEHTSPQALIRALQSVETTKAFFSLSPEDERRLGTTVMASSSALVVVGQALTSLALERDYTAFDRGLLFLKNTFIQLKCWGLLTSIDPTIRTMLLPRFPDDLREEILSALLFNQGIAEDFDSMLDSPEIKPAFRRSLIDQTIDEPGKVDIALVAAHSSFAVRESVNALKQANESIDSNTSALLTSLRTIRREDFDSFAAVCTLLTPVEECSGRVRKLLVNNLISRTVDSRGFDENLNIFPKFYASLFRHTDEILKIQRSPPFAPE